MDGPAPAEKGGDPEVIRESQRRRYVNRKDVDEKVAMVDAVIALDKQWREGALRHSAATPHLPLCLSLYQLCPLRQSSAQGHAQGHAFASQEHQLL